MRHIDWRRVEAAVELVFMAALVTLLLAGLLLGPGCDKTAKFEQHQSTTVEQMDSAGVVTERTTTVVDTLASATAPASSEDPATVSIAGADTGGTDPTAEGMNRNVFLIGGACIFMGIASIIMRNWFPLIPFVYSLGIIALGFLLIAWPYIVRSLGPWPFVGVAIIIGTLLWYFGIKGNRQLLNTEIPDGNA